MGKFFKELLRGLKWLGLSLIILAALIAMWVGCAWSLGWLIEHYVDLQNFGPHRYISIGSGILTFTLIIQIITIIITLWALLAWGRSKGIVKLPKSIHQKGN